VKIGARIVRDGRYVVFQLADVAVPRALVGEILRPGSTGSGPATAASRMSTESNDRCRPQARGVHDRPGTAQARRKPRAKARQTSAAQPRLGHRRVACPAQAAHSRSRETGVGEMSVYKRHGEVGSEADSGAGAADVLLDWEVPFMAVTLKTLIPLHRSIFGLDLPRMRIDLKINQDDGSST
jgi:hypothetical protein